MKKKLKKYSHIILLLLAINVSAQVTITTCVDAKNVISGSNATNYKPEVDLITSVRLIDPYSNFGINLTYEEFKSIEYKKYGFGIAKSFKDKNFTYTPIIELNSTVRYNSNIQHTSYAIINQIDYNIYKNFNLTLILSIQKRKDLEYYFNTSNSYMLNNYIGLSYTLY